MNWPIEQIYRQIDENLATTGQCVVVAPPGAGKSTLLPLHLLEKLTGMILLVEPRRVAARAVAARMASLLGEDVGQTIGYAMRMERKQSAQTRILVVTEGLFSRKILDDPELGGISAVLFDEFHERSLDADFGLALALDVRAALRPDLKLIVMSATLDGARVATLMGNVPIIEAQGQQFEVEIRYQPMKPNERLEQAMARTIAQNLPLTKGTILAFLPGQREIERTAALLAEKIGDDSLIAPLYGALPPAAQDRALSAGKPDMRKIVLATALAQTSLTIEGVQMVIDSGLARLPVYDQSRGLNRLETMRASMADSEQRTGRAGRLGRGIAIRLWHEGQNRARPQFAPPEILSADLSALLLDCAAFGVRDPRELKFLDPPPQAACEQARHLLHQLGALDADGRLSETGAIMRRLGLPVRVAHMVVKNPCRQAAELALILSERGFSGTEIDIDDRLRNFARDRSARAQKIRQLANKIIEQFPKSGNRFSDKNCGKTEELEQFPNQQRQNTLSNAALLLDAWPDRVARSRNKQGQFLLTNGHAVECDATHPFAREDWIVVADMVGKGANSRILAAAALDEATIRQQLGNQIEHITTAEFDPQSGTIRGKSQEKLGALTLKTSPLTAPQGELARLAWVEALRRYGTSILPWDKNSLSLRQRLEWLSLNLGAPWPAIQEEMLIDHMADFLPPQADLKNDPHFIEAALNALIPYEYAGQLDRFAPKYFTAPTGSKIALDYITQAPILRIRVQELFGLNQHPAIAGGKIKLVIELLSPAARPIQITRNLPAFWHGSWQQVRTEMRGRYPKHFWPEDPASAVPTRRAKPRGT